VISFYHVAAPNCVNNDYKKLQFVYKGDIPTREMSKTAIKSQDCGITPSTHCLNASICEISPSVNFAVSRVFCY